MHFMSIRGLPILGSNYFWELLYLFFGTSQYNFSRHCHSSLSGLLIEKLTCSINRLAFYLPYF